jgi:phytoene dehydrogenase-like protein
MSQRWIVSGASTTGIVAAYLLAKQGNDVVLVERGKAIGGVNDALPWNGYFLDLGCHLFGNESDAVTEILLDLLGGEALPVQVRFASIINGKKTEGFELVALDSYGPEVVQQILLEMVVATATEHPEPRNLSELLTARYGARASELLNGALYKVFHVPASELAPQAIHATTFSRIRLLEDAAATLLKGLPALNERLAAGSQHDPMMFYRDRVKAYPHRSFYPLRHGMRGFVEGANERLRQLGVRVIVQADLERLESGADSVELYTKSHGRLSAERLLWTAGLGSLERLLGGENDIAQQSCGAPMVLYYFAIEKAQETGYSYVNSYDLEDLVFRASVPGSYGQDNCPVGMSYVCCEVPTELSHPVWSDPSGSAQRVWQEAVRFGVVRGEPRDLLIKQVPVSYKAPRREFWSKSELLRAQVARDPRLFITDEWAFSTRRTVQNLLEMLGQRQAA